MKEKRDVLKEVLRKYRFEEPLSPQSKKRIVINRKRTLKKILKIKGFSSVFIALAVTIYMNVKKLGFTVSLSKCLVAVYALIATAVIALSAGGVLIVKHIIPKQEETQSINEVRIEEDVKKPVRDTGPQASDTKGSVKSLNFTLVMLPFTFDEKTRGAENTIENAIFTELERIKGINKIKKITSPGEDEHIQKALLGSVAMLDNKYRITVRLLHRKSSRILVLESETAKNNDDIERACKVLAQKIADNI